MEHLSSLDASFVHLETPDTPMHVASLLLLEPPENPAANFYEEVKKLLANRIHLARLLHRKLAPMPFELGDPVWIDDDDVDIDYHVRHVLLPQPGTMEQLEALTARLHSSTLDRSRPLWEVYVIEGLQDGLIGYYNKVHHSGIDGKSGTELANVLYDITPEPRVFEPPVRRQTSGYQLGVTEMFEAGLRNAVMQYAKLAGMLPKAAEVFGGLAGAASRLSDKAQDGTHLRPAPKTLFNVAITNQRSFATMQIPLAGMKALAKSQHATLNDIVMAICAGGLRKFLEARNALPEEPLQAGVPASLREPGDKSMNNQVTMVRVNLATNISDPQNRLDAIRGSSQESKEMLGRVKGMIATDMPMIGSPWIMSGFAMLYGRSNLADRMPAFANVIISNVPGPPKTLYVAGAKMVRYYPVSIPYHGTALNITVQSYAGSMDFGLTACRRAMPQSEMYALMRAMKAAYAELEVLTPSEMGLPAGLMQTGHKSTGAASVH